MNTWAISSFSSVQSLSHVRLFATPWTAARQASLSITNSRSLLKFMSITSVMPSNHLILCYPLLPPSVFSQHQGLFHWVSSSHQVAKLLEFELQDSTWISLYSYCSFQHLWILWFVLCRWASAGPYSYYDTLIARCLVHLTSVSVPDMSSICWVFLDAIADLCKVNFHRTMSKIFCHILIIMNNVELNNCMF